MSGLLVVRQKLEITKLVEKLDRLSFYSMEVIEHNKSFIVC